MNKLTGEKNGQLFLQCPIYGMCPQNTKMVALHSVKEGKWSLTFLLANTVEASCAAQVLESVSKLESFFFIRLRLFSCVRVRIKIKIK